MDCTHIWPSNRKPCTGEVIRCEDFPTPDESCMMTWSRLYGTAKLQLARANPGKYICIDCGSIYPQPAEESLVWDLEVCPI
jgi:hypothetical protein